jgi:hypothetical protein
MSKFSGNVRTICGLATAAAIIVACPAGAEDAICGPPDLSANPVLALGRVTSAAKSVHFVWYNEAQHCPSRSDAGWHWSWVCRKPDYLVPGDRVVISTRRDAVICATYISANAKGVDRSDWLPADAVADDKAEPVVLADWLGHWQHHNHTRDDGFAYDSGVIEVEAGEAGALRIAGIADNWVPVRAAHPEIKIIRVKSDMTPAGDRLSFTSDGCKVWMRRLGPWLIVSPGDGPDGSSATFSGLYTR